MIISHKKKFIFIAIPKTGTYSIEKVLEKYNEEKNIPKHTSLLELNKYCNLKIDKYFIFCFVRNPWDRTVSVYYQVKKKPPIQHNSPLRNFLWNYCNNNSFDLFVEKILKIRILQTQMEKIIGENGQIEIDFVGRFENLQEDFDSVCDKINISKTKLPFLNKSNKEMHYSKYYSDKTKLVISEVYKDEIEKFGYVFECEKSKK